MKSDILWPGMHLRILVFDEFVSIGCRSDYGFVLNKMAIRFVVQAVNVEFFVEIILGK